MILSYSKTRLLEVADSVCNLEKPSIVVGRILVVKCQAKYAALKQISLKYRRYIL